MNKKGYSARMTNDLVFEKTREVLLRSKQKQLKKQEKGNKPKAPVASTIDELKTLFTLDYFGISETQCRLGDFKPLFIAFIAPLHLHEINLSIKHYHEKNLST